jgi:hypothetical protein
MDNNLDPLIELLLTVWALGQENYQGPMSHAIPPRLAGVLRRARKAEMVETDGGLYLLDMGSAKLVEAGFGGSTTFTRPVMRGGDE